MPGWHDNEASGAGFDRGTKIVSDQEALPLAIFPDCLQIASPQCFVRELAAGIGARIGFLSQMRLHGVLSENAIDTVHGTVGAAGPRVDGRIIRHLGG